MRILYLHQYFTLPSGAGGTRSYEMSRRLAAAGHRVTVITSTANLGEIFPPAEGWQTRDVEGVHLEAVGVPYDNAMSFIERVRAFVRFAARASWHAWKSDPDVVFATSTPLTIIIPALAVSLRRRVPLVFEVRDLWPELPIAVGALRHPLLKTAARCLEWIAYRASTHVVALSPGMARGVMRRGIPASKVTVIPNGCDVALFGVPAGDGDWVRQRLGMTPGQPLVVYAGTFGLVNGCGYLVDAAAAMGAIAPEVRFLLVGSGAEAEKLKARAERAGILDRTLWVWPPMPKSQVPGLMAAATIAVSVFIPLKALQDNSANKFFDALAAGKPVAVNHEGWQADILRKGAAGIVLPADDAAKAAVLLSDLLHDPDRLKRASAASRRLARDVFSRDLLAARLARVLEAADRRGGGALRKPGPARSDRAMNARDRKDGFYRRYGKRFLDIVLSLPALIVLAPLMAVLAIVVGISLGAPVLFRQRRPGWRARSFTLVKFRTMVEARDGENPCSSDAERLTPFGGILRRLSLDELPELLNVLKGDMSLVGPRPLLKQYLERYTPEQARRHEVRPGITGWAQVNGRNALTWEERFGLDVWYVDHVSLRLDILILARTAGKVLKREGIHHPEEATMKEFMGSGEGE